MSPWPRLASTSTTRRCDPARSARARATLVFPTPPLPENTNSTSPRRSCTRCPGRGCGRGAGLGVEHRPRVVLGSRLPVSVMPEVVRRSAGSGRRPSPGVVEVGPRSVRDPLRRARCRRPTGPSPRSAGPASRTVPSGSRVAAPVLPPTGPRPPASSTSSTRAGSRTTVDRVRRVDHRGTGSQQHGGHAAAGQRGQVRAEAAGPGLQDQHGQRGAAVDDPFHGARRGEEPVAGDHPETGAAQRPGQVG